MEKTKGTVLVRVRQKDKRWLERLQLPGQSIGDVVAEAVKALFFQRLNTKLTASDQPESIS